MFGQLGCGGMYIFHVGFLGYRMRRCSDGNYDQVGITYPFCHGSGEFDVAFLQVFMKKFFKAVFKQGDFSGSERFDFADFAVNASYLVS